ncbi:FtsW/RodA/SpoVE family cell cycle protein [Paramicrobacterium agarici]|uniref:Cell elongation-specific peptidoglycan biosynthesis regulator RodA n=1 Tax=Paramicrobacterium agarici TaxID=630514 RepID=A0A2A9DTG4_9MICO|nr:FtsW/RodA/SpoVE family cell cycle protein [Microbacterium agarici]PFG29646.1 cell elongation-specific peptidoglycan biosynthesis regulator RodA [Microbacterium agarici]
MADVKDAGSVTTDTAVVRIMRKLHVPQKLRNRELMLLVFASIVNTVAIMLVQLGALGELDYSLLYFGAALSVLVFGLHICLRYVATQSDPLLLPIATVLNGLGIAEIYRIDIAENNLGWAAASTRQIAWSAIAIIAAIVVVLVLRNHRVLFRYTYLFGLGAFVLLLLPLVPGLGRSVNGAKVWIGIGDIMSFQPGEVAKIALAVFFAGYLVRTRDSLSMVGTKVLGVRFPRLRDLGPILVVWVFAMLIIIFERDMGTALLFFGMFTVMLYVATGRLSWVLIGGGLFGAGALVASQYLTYVQNRFNNWINAFDPEVYNAEVGGSWQLVQGIFGLAHGGLIGTGLGQGRPHLTPVAESDYIIASLGEELGLAGIFAILVLYLVLVSRGFRIGFVGQDDFSKLLALGLSFTIALQVFIMVGGVTRVIPLTGLTTPFLAAGGSSLVANWMIIAILLRVSDSVRRKPAEVSA